MRRRHAQRHSPLLRAKGGRLPRGRKSRAASSPFDFAAIAGKINPRWVALAVIVLFAITIIRLAWLPDDYFITLREVTHFLEGRGIVFNPGVRVQAFTHVLWFLLLSGAQFITREHYLTTVVLSAALSLGAIAVMLRWAYQYQYPKAPPIHTRRYSPPPSRCSRCCSPTPLWTSPPRAWKTAWPICSLVCSSTAWLTDNSTPRGFICWRSSAPPSS